jgi:Tfp pilus assembly major pilin PilA
MKKDSPHIFFVAGVVGSLTSTVLACRATLKLSQNLDKIKQDVDNLHALREDVTYPHEQYQKDLAIVYGRAALDISKLYGPSVVLGVASVVALTGSHVQMTRRNSALMAAYATIQQAYSEYRSRVREALGEERELDIYHGAENETVKGEDGKNQVVKVIDPNKMSVYAKCFDESCPSWEKDPELNRLYIQCQQNYANNLLQARGHVFLNEVYDMLGIDRTKAGAVVGWVIGSEGDNYVDFGIYEAFNARFVNGWERSIWLDFNVDGVIYDKI